LKLAEQAFHEAPEFEAELLGAGNLAGPAPRPMEVMAIADKLREYSIAAW